MLAKFAKRGWTLATVPISRLLFDALAANGRGGEGGLRRLDWRSTCADLADEMFDSLSTQHSAWFSIAASTLTRWYHEGKLERFDALTKRCLEELDRTLPPVLWRTLAALNHVLGDREAAVASALKHDGGFKTYRDDMTLNAMTKQVQHRRRGSVSFFKLFE